ncbi:hypothetical protein KQI74_21735 [Paenibacillus barcinonensis]|uniref:hypothetical protein n=1 Tax=Paenibacillus TaxID=44249 RepID=UPI0011A344C1|nr:MULTISPECIES: hypothetical protein [Paenibacillus]MBU5354923.1 hypothetical protein [Paenibacillus barcinonensis]MDM5281764.1 hypothetical protein [Paenibacillus silvae]
MDMGQFEHISMRGRVAYAISCFENIIVALKYDINEWKVVLKYLWEFTNIEYLDDWNEIVVELIPENLMEFESYEKEQFEKLSKEEFLYLFELYQRSDQLINIIIREIYELGVSHAYSVIEGKGRNSLHCLEKIIIFMKQNNFPLPDIHSFQSYSIKENRGWGDRIDGKELSKIIK